MYRRCKPAKSWDGRWEGRHARQLQRRRSFPDDSPHNSLAQKAVSGAGWIELHSGEWCASPPSQYSRHPSFPSLKVQVAGVLTLMAMTTGSAHRAVGQSRRVGEGWPRGKRKSTMTGTGCCGWAAAAAPGERDGPATTDRARVGRPGKRQR
jgi:hypothetical protein